MARTGTAIRAGACAALATGLSVALFATLLRAPPRWQGDGERAIAASLVLPVAAAALDSSQTREPRASTADDTTKQASGEGMESGQGYDAYLPASRLTERPQVLRDIDPEWQWAGLSLPLLACTLLINEYGDVDQVLLREQALSPMLEQDIRARFLAARFSPGKLHGRPVKTALRIEVRLD